MAIARAADDAPVAGVSVSWRAEDMEHGLSLPVDSGGPFTPAWAGTFKVVAAALGFESTSTIVASFDGASTVDTVWEPDDFFRDAFYHLPSNVPTKVDNQRWPHGVGQGNFQFQVPLLTLAGRGPAASLQLTYNSRVWALDSAHDTIWYDADADFPSPGFTIGFGKLVRTSSDVYPDRYELMLVEGNGIRHPFRGVWVNNRYRAFTTDGTYIDYQFNANTNVGIVEYRNGTQVRYDSSIPGEYAWYPTLVTDANGNTLSIVYSENGPPKIRYIQDAMGRVITFYYDYTTDELGRVPLLTAITAPDLGGGQRTVVRFHYHQITLNLTNAFAPGLTPVARRTTSPWVMDAIYFPGTSTGYLFVDSYSSYGMLTAVIEQREIHFEPGGYFEAMGTITPHSPPLITHQQLYDYPTQPDPTLTNAPIYRTLRETWAYMEGVEAVTRYVVHFADDPRVVETTLPNQVREIERSNNHPGVPDDGMVFEDETRDRNNNLLWRHATTWNWDDFYRSPRISEVVTTDERGQVAKITKTYFPNSRDALRDLIEYDYGGTNQLRRTHYAYVNDPQYEANHILDLVSEKDVYDESDRLVSREDFRYDEYPLADTPGALGHGSPPLCASPPNCPIRGNLTTTVRYANAAAASDPITDTRRYDNTGNVIKLAPDCCEETSFEYTAATQYAYATALTRGAVAPMTSPRITSRATFDLNTGLKLTGTNANGRTGNFDYQPASLRLQLATLPTDATHSFTYDDADLSFIETWRDASGGVAFQTAKRVNGRGLLRREEVLAEAGVWNIVDHQYNEMGQLLKTSRPFQTGQTPSQWTENSYDDAGRLAQIRAPEGSTLRQYYNEPTRPPVASTAPGQTERSQDAWGRERWTRSDALNRLVEVVEPNPSGNGSVLSPGGLVTTYRHDALNHLVEARQAAQQRSFKYDSVGRVTHEKLAEKSATLDDNGTYVGNGVWTDRLFYDTRSNLTSRVDARGVKTIYDYASDPLNRLWQIRYDTTGFGDTQNPIEAAPTVTQEYMPDGDVTQLRRVTVSAVSVEDYGYDSERRMNSKTVTLDGRGSFPLLTDYVYDTLNRPSDFTYPRDYGHAGEPRTQVHYDYEELSGRLKALKVDGVEYASQLVYNNENRLTSLKVGASGPNQVTEGYSFDPATGFLSNQAVSRRGIPLLDLSYDYLRRGTSIGRTGQITAMLDNLEHNRDKYYTYDALSRLARLRSGPLDASIWGMDYDYDRYGNRTSVTASSFPTSGALDNPLIPNFPAGLLDLPSSNGGVFISQSVPSLMTLGGNYYVSIRMRNTGDTEWTRERYALGSRSNPPDTWGSTRMTLPPVLRVGPGEEFEFQQFVQVPTQAGTYDFQWQMLQLPSGWFGDQTPNVQVSVVPPGPQAPSDLRLTVRSDTQIDLQWTSHGVPTDWFKIERKAGVRGSYSEILDSTGQPLIIPGDVTSYSDTNLRPGITYFYRVRAFNSIGPSEFSNIASATTSVTVPTDGLPSVSYDANTNRISTSGFAYDAAGNQVRTLRSDGAWQRYQYDAAGHLVRVKNDAGTTLELYTYGLGRQRLKTQYGEPSDARTYYVWDGKSVISEYGESAAAPTSPVWTKNYVHLGSRLLATLTPNDSELRVQFHHPDRLGTRLVTTASDTTSLEQLTLPFGVALDAESTGATNQRFAGYDRSAATGLDYAINRHYDPLQGRFTQADPIGMASTRLGKPQSLNLYAYARNDPVNRVDPTGTWNWSDYENEQCTVINDDQAQDGYRVVCMNEALGYAPDPWFNPMDYSADGKIYSDAVGNLFVMDAAGFATLLKVETTVVEEHTTSAEADDSIASLGGIGILRNDEPSRPSDEVYRCFEWIGPGQCLVGHEWIKTNDKEMGMQRGEGKPILITSDFFGQKTVLQNETGRSLKPNVQCVLVHGVDAACVNSQLVEGRDTGKYAPWNICWDAVEGILGSCSTGYRPVYPPERAGLVPHW